MLSISNEQTIFSGATVINNSLIGRYMNSMPEVDDIDSYFVTNGAQIFQRCIELKSAVMKFVVFAAIKEIVLKDSICISFEDFQAFLVHCSNIEAIVVDCISFIEFGSQQKLCSLKLDGQIFVPHVVAKNLKRLIWTDNGVQLSNLELANSLECLSMEYDLGLICANMSKLKVLQLDYFSIQCLQDAMSKDLCLPLLEWLKIDDMSLGARGLALLLLMVPKLKHFLMPLPGSFVPNNDALFSVSDWEVLGNSQQMLGVFESLYLQFNPILICDDVVHSIINIISRRFDATLKKLLLFVHSDNDQQLLSEKHLIDALKQANVEFRTQPFDSWPTASDLDLDAL